MDRFIPKKVPFVRSSSYGSRQSSLSGGDTSYQPQKPLPSFPVKLQDNLQIPSLWKVWSAIAINLVVALFLAIIPFQPVWIHKNGTMSSGLHTAWVFTTTILATIIKMWSTGIMQTIWAHIAIKPQTSPEAAVLRAKYARSMLGIGSFQDAFRNPQVIGFLFIMAVMLASISAAIAPTDVVVTLSSLANSTSVNVDHCFLTATRYTDDLTFSWKLGNGSYLYSLDVRDPAQVSCPWVYSTAMVKPGLYPQHEGSYAVSGVLVANSSIGAPVSVPGGYDAIFGIANTVNMPADKYYTGPQVHKAEACLPRVARNPVTCQVVPNAMSFEPYNEDKINGIISGTWPLNRMPSTTDTVSDGYSYMYCMQTPSMCGGCISMQPNGRGVDPNHWNGVMADVNRTIGRASFCMAESGTDILAKLVGQNQGAKYDETVVECVIDMDPAIDTETKLVYWNKAYESDSPEPQSTFPWQLSATEPRQACALPNNGTAFRTPEALVSGSAGVYSMIFERQMLVNQFWPTLYQMADDIRTNPKGYNFINSKNPLEDALGVTAGASISIYWGSVVNNDGHKMATTYEVEWVVLGPRQPWAIMFAIPSLVCAVLIFVLHLKMGSVRRAGYEHVPMTDHHRV